MAVEKMYFVNIAGPLKALDEFVINTIAPHEIQLVRAFSILDSVKGLEPFTDPNPYEGIYKKLEGVYTTGGFEHEEIEEQGTQTINIKEIEKQLDFYNETLLDLKKQRDELSAKRARKEQIRKQIIPIQNLDIEVDKLFEFQHMKFRFGKMPKDSFSKLQEYVANLDVIVYEMFQEEEDTFLIYFTPGILQETIDGLFASLYFERIRISGEVKGYPKEALARISSDIVSLDKEIMNIDQKMKIFYEENKIELSKCYSALNRLNQVFEVRQYAAHSKEGFYLTGWMPESTLDEFSDVVKKVHGVTCIVEEDDAIKKMKPPTKLNNPKFFKPFEMLVTMYGIPSYKEIDPTIFVGITYVLLFALMFGDIGQGFVIALLGYLIYKKTKSSIGLLALYLGVGSMVSGTVYGSIFGNEHFLRERFGENLFLDAMAAENMFVVLGGAIGLGIIIIIIAMVFNLVNSMKSKDYGRLLFDKNGIVGLVFYLSILYLVVSFIGKTFSSIKLSIVPAIILIVTSLMIIFFSHPLQNLIRRKKEIIPEDKVGFFVGSAFEMFEVVLSVLSNTLSFMRIGAFAMNHVGFSLAVQILSEMTSGSGSIIIMIIGNILIIGLEGMIVVIQGLRLEYYELFSRFFEGEGVEFKPYSTLNKISR